MMALMKWTFPARRLQFWDMTALLDIVALPFDEGRRMNGGQRGKRPVRGRPKSPPLPLLDHKTGVIEVPATETGVTGKEVLVPPVMLMVGGNPEESPPGHPLGRIATTWMTTDMSLMEVVLLRSPASLVTPVHIIWSMVQAVRSAIAQTHGTS